MTISLYDYYKKDTLWEGTKNKMKLFVSYCGRGQQILVGEPWRKGFFGGLVRVKKTDIFWTIGFLTQQCGQNFCEISGGGRGGVSFFYRSHKVWSFLAYFFGWLPYVEALLVNNIPVDRSLCSLLLGVPIDSESFPMSYVVG